MSGILLIGVVLVWTVIAITVALAITSKLKPVWVKPIVGSLLIVALISLPVADEIIGRNQLKALCEKNGPKELEFARARNTTLIENLEPISVDSQLLQTEGFRTILKDITSNKEVLSFTDYRVKGGMLIRALGISETNAPLIFNSGCWGYGDEAFQGWLDRYQIKLLFNAGK